MADAPIRGPGNHHMMKKGPSDTRITKAEALDIEYHTDIDDSLLDKDEVAALRGLMDASGGDDEEYYKDKHYLKKEDDEDNRRFDKHFGPPFCLNEAFLDYVDRDPAIDVIEGIHGYGTRLIGGSVWITGNGRFPMGLHIDYQPFGLPEDIAGDPRVQIPIMVSTLHIYLDDMYMDLGPTLIAVGSHKSGRVPDEDTGWNGSEAKALVCKAGDAMLFRSDVWHGALPNLSNERRYMLQVHYGAAYIARPFISPWMNRSFPEEFVDACTDRQRRLLGERQEGFLYPQGSYVLQQQDGENPRHQA